MTIPRDIFIELCRNNPEEVYRIFCVMEEQIKALEARVIQLESLSNKDSHNSSKPPSSDQKRPQPKSLRKKSAKKSGGQPGHAGHTLKQVEKPDQTITHQPKGRCHCGRPKGKGRLIGYKRRQVFDLPSIELEVTEHQVEVLECDCGRQHTAEFPKGVDAPVQYGGRVRAMVLYLSAYQLLPQKRTTESLADLFGVQMSEGTLNQILIEAYNRLAGTEKTIKAAIRSSPVMHLDETGMYVNGKRLWEHNCSTPLFTYYFCHAQRGKEAIKEGGMLFQYLGRAVHDGWKSYFDWECLHALCNAHHLRELIFIKEEYGQRWADTMITLLCRIKRSVDRAKVAGRSSLAPMTLRRYRDRYEKVIQAGCRVNPIQNQERRPGQRGRIKKTQARNLVERLEKYADEALAFMYDFRVPFDNNLSERDLRMTKVKQKVSGCFRSMAGAQAFCRIRGFISTVRKHGLNVFDQLLKCFDQTNNVVLIPE